MRFLLGLLQRLPGQEKFAAATNAILAEHLLFTVELVPQNPFAKFLMDQIISVCQASGVGNTGAVAIDFFNARSRFEQLNLIAMALAELDQVPMLGREVWVPVRNPFTAALNNEGHVRAVKARLKSAYGVDVEFRRGKFRIERWGLRDTARDSDPPF